MRNSWFFFCAGIGVENVDKWSLNTTCGLAFLKNSIWIILTSCCALCFGSKTQNLGAKDYCSSMGESAFSQITRRECSESQNNISLASEISLTHFFYNNMHMWFWSSHDPQVRSPSHISEEKLSAQTLKCGRHLCRELQHSLMRIIILVQLIIQRSISTSLFHQLPIYKECVRRVNL